MCIRDSFRADKVIEDDMADNGIAIEGSVDAWSNEQMENYIKEKEICCPSCGKKNFKMCIRDRCYPMDEEL